MSIRKQKDIFFMEIKYRKVKKIVKQALKRQLWNKELKQLQVKFGLKKGARTVDASKYYEDGLTPKEAIAMDVLRRMARIM